MALAKKFQRHDKAFCEGAQAQYAGEAKSTNPFDGEGTIEEASWDEGWEAAGSQDQWAATTAVEVGQIRGVTGPPVAWWVCRQAGNTGSTELDPTDDAQRTDNVPDGTASWVFIGEGTAVDLGAAGGKAGGIPYVGVWR